MKQYYKVVEKVQELLRVNSEWKDRYAKYMVALKILIDAKAVPEAQKKFSVPMPFQLYLPLSMAVNDCNTDQIVFDLRFHGQSVATLWINKKKDDIKLKIKHNKNVCSEIKKDTDKKILDAIKDNKYDWHSIEAKEFRRIYTELEEELNKEKNCIGGQPEHNMESMLLQNYAQMSSMQKEISNIQPVTMLGSHVFFQMPTPIRASNVKKNIDQLEYANQYGGGIDILARVGIGRKTTLAVLELKDENKASESPECALRQAIAYATFLHALLRSDCGQQWWEFFGFGGIIPKELKLKVVVVMPYRNNKEAIEQHTQEFIDSIQKENIIQLPDTMDQFELGYIFRDSTTGEIIKFLD